MLLICFGLSWLVVVVGFFMNMGIPIHINHCTRACTHIHTHTHKCWPVHTHYLALYMLKFAFMWPFIVIKDEGWAEHEKVDERMSGLTTNFDRCDASKLSVQFNGICMFFIFLSFSSFLQLYICGLLTYISLMHIDLVARTQMAIWKM